MFLYALFILCLCDDRPLYIGVPMGRRGKIHLLTFEIYRSENDFYCGHSYIARYDERIRFNGKTNDRCAADRSGNISYM